MKRVLQLCIVLFLSISFVPAYAQLTATIGTGTTSNTTTGYPAPFGNWYESSKHQMIYTAAELTAAGVLPGALINGAGFNVTAFNTSTPTYTGFTVDAKMSTTAAFVTAYETGMTNVFTGSYSPTLGWNMFTFASPIVWNGTDNLIIGTCHSINAPYTQNMSTEWTTGAATNLTIYERTDGLDVCPSTVLNGIGFGAVTGDRPNLQVSFIPPAGCIQPVAVATTNITTVGADISWSDPNAVAAMNYDIYAVATGSPAPTSTTTPTYAAVTANPYTANTLMPQTTYDIYVRAHCTATDTSAWGGPHTFTTLPLCQTPTNPTASNFVYDAVANTFTVDLSWTDNNVPAATVWDLEIAPTGLLGGIANVPGQTANPFTTPGLPPNTCFDYTVWSVCGGPNGTSPMSTVYTFCTPCAPLFPSTASPSCEGFESLVNGNRDDFGMTCFDHGTTRTVDPAWTIRLNGATGSVGTGPGPTSGATGWAHTGAAYIYLETSGAGSAPNETDTFWTTQYEVSGLTVPCLSFWYYMHGALVNQLDVEVTGDGGATWTNIASITGQQQTAQTDPWIEQVVNLAAYANMTIQFRFIGTGPAVCCSGDIALDDICVLECPTCLDPTNLTATNLTTTSADLGWTAANVPPAGSYNIEWGPTGFAPTAVANATSTTNPYALTGLTAATCYDYYVQADCGVANGTSAWVGPFTFCTPCVTQAVDSATQYCEDFTALPICWNESGSVNWALDASGAAYANFWGNAPPATFIFTTQPIAIDPGMSPQLCFDWARNGAASATYNDQFDVEISNDNGVTWTNIWTNCCAAFTSMAMPQPTVSALNGAGFDTETVLLNAYIGQTVLFRYTATSDFGPSLWIDNVCVKQQPQCVAPSMVASTNITQTQADISWTENNTPAATLWNIEVVPSGTVPTGIPTASGVTNPYTLTGLLASFCYDVYVQADCGAVNGTSAWTAVHTFCTSCAPVTVAQFCAEGTFGHAVTGTTTPPICWTSTSSVAATTTALWGFNVSGNPPYTPAYGPGIAGAMDHTTGTTSEFAWVDGSYSSGAIVTLTSNEILNADIVAMTNPTLEFYLKSNETNGIGNNPADNNTLTARASYDLGATWVDVVVNKSDLSANWHLFAVELDVAALGTNNLMVQFEWNGNGSTSFFNDILLDDVCIVDKACIGGYFTGIASINGVADCECTDLAGWTHYGTELATEVYLSVEKIAAGDPLISAPMIHVQGAATGATDIASTAGYGNPIPASPFTFIMDRFWDISDQPAVTPLIAGRQPSAALDVRFYYYDADLAALNAAITGVGGMAITHTDMYAYKIDNGTVPTVDPVASAGHASILPADYNHYTNGASSLSTWAYAAGTWATTNDMQKQVSTFSGGGGGGPVLFPLPVELLSFTATKAGSVTDLAWTTASEENNSHFNVQKSTNGTDFELLGKVDTKAPNGNSAIKLNYTSVDESPILGHNYYRLEQVDLDGQKHYSEILDVIWGVNGDLVSIYPNPTNGSLNVDIATEKVSKVEVRVLDMTGRSILVKNATIVIGTNNVQMDLGDVAPGVYNVQVYTNGTLTHTDKVKKN